MNLRILKKLSKRALPMAEQAGLLKGQECFVAANSDECYTGIRGFDTVLKGTPMVGAMEGYYEPEWEERTVWEELCGWLYCSITDWRADPPELECPRPKNPAQIFDKARKLIRERG